MREKPNPPISFPRNLIVKTLSSFLVAMLFLSMTLPSRAENWPQWRGPRNDGHSAEKGLPTTWSETKNVAWKLELPGIGSSTPIIWGDRIFLTAAVKNEVVLLCADTNGKMLWSKTVGKTARGNVRNGEGNDASSTCSTDGKLVFAYFGSGDMACFDFDGKQVWHVDIQERYGKFKIQHGMHITPLLHEDCLYMALLHNGGHWIIALDKATGKEVWKAARKTDAVSESREAYTSPVLWQNGKELNLVILGCDYATGHSLKDGGELWRLGDLNPGGKNKSNHRIICSPVAAGEQLIVPTCRGLHVVAVKQGITGSVKAGNEFEQWRIPKGAGDVSSPLVVDGLVYLAQDRSTVYCLDAKTGDVLYRETLTDGRYRASPVCIDGNVYLTGRDSGVITVLKAGRKLEVLANNRMNDEFTASPAVSNGRVYLRGFKTLYAISEGGK
jgi:outer membrane protein assembly factor BamB